jgi:nitric oxide reductase NorQ protein
LSSQRVIPERPKEKTILTSEGSGVKLNITITKSKLAERPELFQRYTVQSYDLLQGQTFSNNFKALIPRGTPEYVEHGERYVERIMRALYHFKQCALIGPSGTGKTHIVYLVAEIAGLPLWEINCGLQTSAYDLFGRYVGLGKENWIDGQIVSWCRNGGILYLDEANMMKQDVATRLNPVLDTRGHLVLTEKDNEIIARNPAGYVIISMNPYSAEFAGTKPLNAAFRRRMSVWIDFDYLSVGNKIAQDEIDLVEKRGRVIRDVATGIVRIGAELRRQYKANEIPYGPSVGDLVNWATLSSDGVSPEQAAEETIIAMTSDNLEIQETVRRIVHMVFAGNSTRNSAPPDDNPKFDGSRNDKGQATEQAQGEEESSEAPRNEPKAHLSNSFESEYTNDEF